MNAKRLLLFASLFSVALSLWALPTAVKNRAFFEGITYKWPYNAETADQTESNLAQVATDPDQIIAMLREVYSNKTIPGNYVRGYDANGAHEGTWVDGVATGRYPVAYPGIGVLAENNGVVGYVDKGWALPGTVKHVTDNSVGTVSFTAGVDKPASSSGTSMSKEHFHIRYMGNLSGTSFYLMQTGYDYRYATDPGFKMTNVRFTFTASNYGSTYITQAKYRDENGNMVTINDNSTPSISSFKTSSTEFVWTIPTDTLALRVTGTSRVTSIEATYEGAVDDYHFEPNAYLPNEEGNTVLLVEVKDGMTVDNLLAMGLACAGEDGKFEAFAVNDYASLRALVAATIKSVRLLTESKPVGSGLNSGTMFKIDCDKLNRFFLLGKGQLRWFNNDYKDGEVNATKAPRFESQFNDYQPYYFAGNYYDQSIEALFGHMFEQFSPAVAKGGTAKTDIYRLLVGGESFPVVHDCIDVLSAEGTGHEFNMKEKTSVSDDCQDVRDMMFFLPNYRMQAFTNNQNASLSRDPNKAQRYVYYNGAHAPTVGLYVIQLAPITQVDEVAGQAAYDVTLNWRSNLLDFLPGETGKYTLYRVTTDADGIETYTPLTEVSTDNASELTYVDRVAQTPASQTVTYAVRGQDQDGFLSLQMSNKESALIPGTTASEQLQLQLGTDNYSRFDPELVQNNYSNQVKLGEGQVTNIQAANLTTDGTEQFTFNRSYTDAQGNKVTTPFATAHVASMAGNAGTLQVTLLDQSFFNYGYQSNGNNASADAPNGNAITVPFTYDATGVNFNGLTLFDNFSVSVDDNAHPAEYVYQVMFDYVENGEPMTAYSNEMSVYVQKTDLAMGSTFTREQVDGDTERALPAGKVCFDVEVKYSSKKDILRYGVYRWNEGDARNIIDPASTVDNEQVVPPTGIAGNQGDFYSVAMNTGDYLYTGETDGWDNGVARAHFEDSYAAATLGAYTYVPVVEQIPANADRTDYNTYGAPLRHAVTGKVEVDEYTGVDGASYPSKSEYIWEGADGKTYTYYVAQLTLRTRGEQGETLIPDGYELYKVRTWRQIDESLLAEELPGRQDRLNGDLLVEELTYPDITAATAATTPLCASPATYADAQPDELTGTFGAIDVTDGELSSILAKFIVRAYYTRSENLVDAATGAPRRAQAMDDAEYYVVEGETTVMIDVDRVTTGITGVHNERGVAAVTYYNMQGVASSRPVAGVNVRVIRYTDGTVQASKVRF